MRKRLSFVVIGVAIALMAGDTFAAPSEQAIQELYKVAKTEGQVIWSWGGMEKEFMPVAKAFESKYPGVKCSVVSISGTTIHTRVITEAAAGKVSFDMGTVMPEILLPLLQRDLLAKYDWSKISDGDPGLVLFDGAYIIIFDYPLVWLSNTKMVPKADVPKTWDDLLDAKWKGSKLSVRAYGQSFAGLFPEWRKNPQKVIGYIERLRMQEVMPGTRFADVVNRIATGECPAGNGPALLYAELLKEGAPLMLCPISPAVGTPMGPFIPKGAPHPNAAKLLMSWLSSNEGRGVFTNVTGSGIASPANASPLAKMLADAGIKFQRIASMEELEAYLRFVDTVAKVMKFTPN
jgi:iron(III) transport system substrate-binding protein